MAATNPAAGSAPQRFDVMEFDVQGNTVLKIAAIERAVYDYLGPGKSFEDVEGARASLEKAYHDVGFATVSVYIPEQQVKDGVIVLTVLEGRIEQLRVRNANYYSQGRILAKVPDLAEGQVPNLKAAQTELAEVNNSEDRRVTPLLHPGKVAGTTDVDLEVEDQLPLHGNLELNNYYTPDTSHTRLLGGLHYDNLFQLEQRLGLQFQVSPEDSAQVRVCSGSYSIPFKDQTLLVTAVRSNSNTFVGGGVGVFGTGSILGLHDLFLLPGSSTLSQTLNVGLDFKDFQQNVAVADAGGFGSPVHYAPFSLTYMLQQGEPKLRWEYSAGFEFAVRNFLSIPSDFDNKRYQAQNNFSILRLSLARTQIFENDTSLYLRVDGQLTGEPLISNEQYVAGGVDSVRGYLDASETGDSALRATIEFRTANLVAPTDVLKDLRAHVFLDGATLRILAPLPGTATSNQLAAIGFGLRAKTDYGGRLVLDFAWPMKDSVYQRAWSPHLQASTSVEF